jgi:hypothetical protein
MDKHEKIIIYNNENIFKKRPKKMVWLFLDPEPFLKVVLSGSTQEWVCPIMINANNATKTKQNFDVTNETIGM